MKRQLSLSIFHRRISIWSRWKKSIMIIRTKVNLNKKWLYFYYNSINFLTYHYKKRIWSFFLKVWFIEKTRESMWNVILKMLLHLFQQCEACSNVSAKIIKTWIDRLFSEFESDSNVSEDISTTWILLKWFSEIDKKWILLSLKKMKKRESCSIVSSEWREKSFYVRKKEREIQNDIFCS